MAPAVSEGVPHIAGAGEGACGRSEGTAALCRPPARARIAPNGGLGSDALHDAAADGLPDRAAEPTLGGGQGAAGRDSWEAGAVTRFAMQIRVQKGSPCFQRVRRAGAAGTCRSGAVRATYLPRAAPTLSRLSARLAPF